jgi:hypothetical protein
MRVSELPLDTWLVVEQQQSWREVKLVSTHATQNEAEAERDKRNEGLNRPRFSACIVLEPVAERMGCSACEESRIGDVHRRAASTRAPRYAAP